MGKTEFLEILRTQLSGQMQENRIQSHLRYYQNYIEGQVNGGRSEASVLEELGDPRLIAKTLLDTDEEETVFGEEYQQKYTTPSKEPKPEEKRYRWHLNLSSWYGKAIVILIAAVLIFGLLVVIGTILPILIVVSLFIYLISRFRKS